MIKPRGGCRNIRKRAKAVWEVKKCAGGSPKRISVKL